MVTTSKNRMETVSLGRSLEVFYTAEEHLHQYQDVFLISEEGNKFGYNRCLLASISPACYQMFSELYRCPLANSDSAIYINTNMTCHDLSVMNRFFYSGVLPTLPSTDEIDLEASAVFHAFGLNIATLMHSNLEKQEFEIKQENVNDYQEFNDGIAAFQDSEDDEKPLASKVKSKKRPTKNALKENARKKVKRELVIKIDTKLSAKKVAAKVPKKDYGLFEFPQEGERDLEMIFQCQRCIRGFKDLKEYKWHFHHHDMEVQDPSKAFICTRCFKFEAGSKRQVELHGRKECEVARQDDAASKFTYYCAICDQVFQHAMILSNHMREKHPKESALCRRYLCQACGRNFQDSSALRKHFKIEGPFHLCKCSMCDREFGTWDELSSHLQSMHDNQYKYLCGLCGISAFETCTQKDEHRRVCKISTATTQVRLCEEGKTACTMCGMEVVATAFKVRAHFKDYHAELKIPCEFCGEVFFLDEGLQEHIKNTHLNSARYSCDMCDKTFPSKSQMRFHQESAHGKTLGDVKPSYHCAICDIHLSSRVAFSTHNYKKHGKGAEAIKATEMCTICGLTVSAGYLKRHMAHLHGTQKLPCKVCESVFKDEMALEAHVKACHTMVTCEECGMPVKKAALKLHKLQHHCPEDQKPYYCGTCKKGFITKQRYHSHMNIHTGECPHQCPFCERRFGDYSNMMKHKRVAHKDQIAAAAKATT